MCLVSIIPTENGCILSSNRDEYPNRDAQEVITEHISSSKVIYPRDVAGGSWIILSENNRAVCLLNGARQNHKRILPYRLSRGVMMKEFFNYESAVDFFEQYDFWNIEPFTMVIIDATLKYEFIWDGNTKHIKELAQNEIHIWSSSTLYDQAAIMRREKLLRKELVGLDTNDLKIIKKAHLHKDPDDPALGLYVNLGGIVETISHTQILLEPSRSHLIYHNLLNNREEKAIM